MVPPCSISPSVLNAFPTFDGETETLIDYMRQFNRIVNSLGLTSVQAQAILPVRLRGRAALVYDEIEIEEEKGVITVTDYQSLQNELFRRLSTDTSKIKARCELSTRMKEGETLAEFASKVRRNVLSAFPLAKDGMEEEIMCEKFLAGLPRSLYSKMMGKTYSKLNTCLEQAEQKLLMIELCKNNGMEQRIVDKLTNKLSKTKIDDTLGEVNYVSHDRNWYGNNSFREESDRDSCFDYHYDQNDNFDQSDGEYNFGNQDRFGGGRRDRYDNDYHNFDQDGSEREEYRENSSNGNQEYDGTWSNEDDSDGNSGGRSSRFNEHVNFLVLICCLMSVLISPVSGHNYFSCSRNGTTAMLFIPKDDTYKCETKWNDRLTVVTTAQLFRENITDFTMDAFVCSDITSKVSVSAFAGIFNLSVEVDTTEKPVSREEYVQREMTKTSSEGKLRETSPELWMTDIAKQLLPYFGKNNVTTTHRILQYGKIFALQSDLLVSSFGNMNNCRLEKGFCKIANKSLVWNAFHKPKQCMESIGQFNVWINDDVIIISDLGKVLHPKEQTFEINPCSKLGTLALSENFYMHLPKFPQTKSFAEISSVKKRRIIDRITTPVTLTKSSNWTKTFTRNESQVNVENELSKMNINRVYLETCESQRWVREKLIGEIQNNPTPTVQILLNRMDVTAEKVDESIYRVYLCDQVRIDKMVHSRKVNGSVGSVEEVSNGSVCYEYQPVVLDGQVKFVNEDTLHIHQESPTMNCLDIPAKIRRNSQKGRDEKHKQPTVTQIQNNETNSVPILGFFQTGIQSIDEYKNSLGIWDKIKYGFDKIKEKALSSAKEGTAKVVNIAVEIKEKVVEYASSWITFLRSLLLGVLICVIIGGSVYLLLKYWLWKELTSCCLTKVGSQIVRSVSSSPSVNYIRRNREISVEEHRFKKLMEQKVYEEQEELMEFRVKRVRTLPQTEVLLFCVAICTLMILPTVEANIVENTFDSDQFLLGYASIGISIIIVVSLICFQRNAGRNICTLRDNKTKDSTEKVEKIERDSEPQVNAIIRGKLPHLKIQIQQTEIVTLFDTASSISFIKESVFKKLKYTRLNTTESPPARTANGGQIDFRGESELSVQIGNVRFNHLFQVTQDDFCPAEVIIGIDFMSILFRKGYPITFTQKGIRIGNSLKLKDINSEENADQTKLIETTNDKIRYVQIDSEEINNENERSDQESDEL